MSLQTSCSRSCSCVLRRQYTDHACINLVWNLRCHQPLCTSNFSLSYQSIKLLLSQAWNLTIRTTWCYSDPWIYILSMDTTGRLLVRKKESSVCSHVVMLHQNPSVVFSFSASKNQGRKIFPLCWKASLVTCSLLKVCIYLF